MENLKSIAQYLFTAEAIAAYVVGASVIYFGIRQLRINLTLNKKSTVFDELSKQIKEAMELTEKIGSNTEEVLRSFAEEADREKPDLSGLSRDEVEAETARVDATNKKLIDRRMDLLNSIFDSVSEILSLIRAVERSTMINKDTKAAARHLFFVATDQHELVSQANDVLISFNVIPTPNISSDIFIKFAKLYRQINVGNSRIRNFLDDLEVILHNDLVEKVYGKAQFANHPDEHLTTKGITDRRGTIPLI